jgi:superfamily II DNA or RNA helicase
MQWRSGDQVFVRGRDWRIRSTTVFADCEALDLSRDDGSRRTVLVPFDRPRLRRPERLTAVSRRRWLHLAASTARSSFPYGGLQYCPPGIRLLPYQLEPALAMLRHGAHRVLVADDVGLGKTVEAGLLIREVMGRAHTARVLVVVPASLRDQWRQELASLFALEATDACSTWLRRSAAQLPRDVNPWSVPGLYVASADFVKRAEALRPLEYVRWDLLVVDEAHTATPASDRRAAVDALARRSQLVVLLTATPHSGDPEQFESLCRIGAIGDSPPLVCFRRARADTALDSPPVHSRVLPIRLTALEERMHRLVEAYTARVWAESRDRPDGNPALLATLLRKRALSSPSSLAVSVRRRLQLLTGSPRPPVQLPLLLCAESDDHLEDEAADAVLGGPGLLQQGDEVEALERVREAAAGAEGCESKLQALLRLLRRVREPAIVFSEYRDTADRIAAALARQGHLVERLHGGLGADERRQAVARFAGAQSVLVATDAAAEGLNLHRPARLVIHFELPWTSSRLHQRCGRVNRIGQTRTVHEIALVASDTAEHLVLLPLLQRARRSAPFHRTPIVRCLAETRIAAHVLGGAPLNTSEGEGWGVDVARVDLHAEASEEAARLELLRRLGPWHARGVAPAIAGTAISWGRKRARRASSRVGVVLTVSLRDARGNMVERQVLAVEWSGVDRASHDDVPRLGERVARLLPWLRPALDEIVSTLVAQRLESIGPLHTAAVAAANQRHGALAGELDSTAQALVQAGLFDRRALRASARLADRPAPAATWDDEHRGGGGGPETQIEASYEITAVRCGGFG